MASSYKASETQLLALYRLEFYKNRKDWKLYEGVRREPPPSAKIFNVLNKTYNIGKDFPVLTYDGEYISSHKKTFLDEEPESLLELKPAEDALDLHLEYLTPAQMREKAENWLTLQGVPMRQEEYGDTCDECGFVDESAGFVPGAHTVPHSSKTELSVAQEYPCTCNTSLSVLSARQLARAIQRHHSALTLLLREQALRETLSSRSLLHFPIPFEVQTPDSALSSAHRKLSTSRHNMGHGRGRGLLQQHSVIGIGRGTPYRL